MVIFLQILSRDFKEGILDTDEHGKLSSVRAKGYNLSLPRQSVLVVLLVVLGILCISPTWAFYEGGTPPPDLTVTGPSQPPSAANPSSFIPVSPNELPSLIPSPSPLFSPPSGVTSRPKSHKIWKIIYISAIAVSTALFLSAIRTVWNHVNYKRSFMTFSDAIGVEIDNAFNGVEPMESVVENIDELAKERNRQRHLMAEVFFSRVEYGLTDATRAATILGLLGRKNTDYLGGLEDLLERFITNRRRGTPNDASNQCLRVN